MGKFDRTLNQVRIPMSKRKFEGLTGTPQREVSEQSQLQKEHDSAETEDEKKKIRQRAHLLGYSLE